MQLELDHDDGLLRDDEYTERADALVENLARAREISAGGNEPATNKELDHG
jgi:hypothetical protein